MPREKARASPPGGLPTPRVVQVGLSTEALSLSRPELETCAEPAGRVTPRLVSFKRARSVSSCSDGTTTSCEKSARSLWQRGLGRRVRCRHELYLRENLESMQASPALSDQSAVRKAKTKQLYAEEVANFLQKSGIEDPLTQEDTIVDGALVGLFTDLFMVGEQASRGMKIGAAILYRWPDYKRMGGRDLPRMWKALKGWKNLAPARTREAVPLVVWAAIFNGLVAMGFHMMAIFMALAVSTYAAPISLFMLHPADIVPPKVSEPDFWSLLVHPAGRVDRSKTRDAGTMVQLDSSWLLFLGPVLEQLRGQRSDLPVWGFRYPQLLAGMHEVCHQLGIEDITPYQARHSGASIDRSNGERSRAAVQRRGEWKHFKSRVRHENSASLRPAALKYDVTLVAHGEECRLALERILVWGETIPLPRGTDKGCCTMPLLASRPSFDA